MKLLVLLIALGLEYFPGGLDRFRSPGWFDRLAAALEARFGRESWWDGRGGVLLTLAVPLGVLLLAGCLLGLLHGGLPYLLALVVLVYSLGPDVNVLMNRYITAVAEHDSVAKAELESHFLPGPATHANQTMVIEAFLLRFHERVCGVIFWFIILDAIGALLFCLTVRLLDKYRDIHGAHANAVRDLYRILCWPSARMLAIGFSIAGSLREGLEGWFDVQGDGISASEDIIRYSGLGAMGYTPDHAPAEETDQAQAFAGWLTETQALLRRTLIVWLAVLGFITIPGWLS
ncbi:MAG: hypothetical protein ACR2P9_04790 [Gammaproteobacteria bacterium]